MADCGTAVYSDRSQFPRPAGPVHIHSEDSDRPECLRCAVRVGQHGIPDRLCTDVYPGRVVD